MDGETCEHCPMKGTAETCPRWPTDHVRYCEWVDPSHPDHRPDGAEAIVRIARRRAQPPPPADDREAVMRRRAGKVRLRLGEKAPEPAPGRR